VLLDRADYLVRLRDLEDDPPAILAAIARFEDTPSIPISIRRKKREKDLDLKSLVAHLRFAGDADRAALPSALDAALGARPLALGLRLDGAGQVKPEEALRAILGDAVRVSPVDIVRVGFWHVDGPRARSPLEATHASAQAVS
jgi:hypothetical protein